MLSYSWAHQEEVLRIRDALRSRGFTVWIDVEQMTDDIYETMRNAILSSRVVLPCLTQQYENSDNCKRELYYTAGLQNPPKRIVPIRLDNGPFTWSEFLTAGKLYTLIDFSNVSKMEWELKIDSLEKEIRRSVSHTNLLSPELPSYQSSLATYADLKSWLKPEEVEMENDIEELFRKQFPGTREWLYSKIIEFAKVDNEQVFWTKGVAGVGKSVVSAVVCKRLQTIGKLGGYFFCKHNNVNRNKPQRVIATLCFQLCQHFTEFANVINGLRESQEDFLEKANLDNYFAKLISEPLKKISRNHSGIVIVIDALDEIGVISSPERKALINLLANWKDVPKFVKLFITSRPESDIQNILCGVFQAHEIDLNDELQRNDLLLFSKSRLRQLQNRIGVSSVEIDELAERLAEKANGLFIWLALAADEICHEDSDSLAVLIQYLGDQSDADNNDRQMDKMFISTLERATHGKSESFVESLAKILAAIVVVRTPLSDDSLAKLFGTTLSDIRAKLSPIRSILNISDNCIQVIHKSFGDFLQSSTRCTDSRFLVDISTTNEILTCRCLDAMNAGLHFNMGGFDVENMGSIATIDPPQYLAYSAKHWISHLLASDFTTLPESIVSSLETFSRSHLLHWVEILALTDSLTVAQVLLPRCLSKIENTEITRLVRDVSRLVNEFRTPISQSAIHVYFSALSMCPEHTSLYNQYAPQFKTVMHRIVAGKRSRVECMCCYVGRTQ
ncbi:hypothetical protein HK098_003584 [Nowakowskiella sp. JEL0407]|nr:hypothetical protein HK098_003584 [Nowakowskiella sp. JEL0407]